MTDTKYNGWTNYATWRVNLEMFDGLTVDDICDMDGSQDVGLLADCCNLYAEETISSGVPAAYADTGRMNLLLDYAMAFLADVNWVEIAQRLMDNE